MIILAAITLAVSGEMCEWTCTYNDSVIEMDVTCFTAAGCLHCTLVFLDIGECVGSQGHPVLQVLGPLRTAPDLL